jgi:pimeloyl-ACP methyl ester carboxylesterase
MTRIDLIPGTMCDERIWSALLPCLPAGLQAHCVPLQHARTRQAMRETIARESGEAAHLVAFSMGGYLALEHALSHPQRVRSLTIIGASARGLGTAERQQRLRVLEALRDAAQRQTPFAAMPPSRLAQFIHPSRLQDPAVAGVVQAMYLALGAEVLEAQIRETMDRPDLVERLAELRCPVMVVAAEDDQIAAAADLTEMHRHLAQGQLCVLPQTGHMIALEQPRALAAAIAACVQAAA